MYKSLQILFYLFIGLNSVSAQETFNTMFYNVLNFPDQLPINRIQYLELIIADYNPDIFMICELNNETGANTILSTIQEVNPNYQRATFVPNTSDDDIGDSNDLQNMIYFDNTKFSLEIINPGAAIEDQIIIQTNYRDFNHYKLKVNTTDQATNPLYLNVIVGHLKSSSGTTNQNLRLAMVQALEAYFDTLPSNEYVMLAGDLNLYTNSEPAFQELIDTDTTNDITFIDPADRIGSWSNNTSYIDVFTQSTRNAGSGLGGATGGFDDRFDFIMTTENMQISSELSFVNGSYRAFGNNGLVSCYNQDINSSNCGISDATDEFPSGIREALYNFSDHLPVALQLQTDRTLSTPDYLTSPSLRLMGSNIIRNQIKLKITDTSLNIYKLKIYNVLGQEVKTITLKQEAIITEDVSTLAPGIYYIATEQLSIEPLKFIKAD